MMDLLYHAIYIHFSNDKACLNEVGNGLCGSLTGDGVKSINLTTSTSKTPTFFPQEDSITTETITSPFDIATPSSTTASQAASSNLPSSSFAASSSVHLSALSTTALQSLTAPGASSSLSSNSSLQAETGSSQSGGNNRTKIIVPSVVVPMFLICLIACVFRRWKSLKSSREVIKDEDDDREKSVDPKSSLEAANQPSRGRSKTLSTYVKTVSASDTESALSRFPSLPNYTQARLKDRTAEPDPPEE